MPPHGTTRERLVDGGGHVPFLVLGQKDLAMLHFLALCIVLGLCRSAIQTRMSSFFRLPRIART
jgi:hypothetical protein